MLVMTVKVSTIGCPLKIPKWPIHYDAFYIHTCHIKLLASSGAHIITKIILVVTRKRITIILSYLFILIYIFISAYIITYRELGVIYLSHYFLH